MTYNVFSGTLNPTQSINQLTDFWATVSKTVRIMLLNRRLSYPSVLYCSVCLWRWCIVAKRLDGPRWNLARR